MRVHHETTFSVRWSGRIIADETGIYQFRANYDDAYRLWVDNELIINGWSGGPAVVVGEANLAILDDLHLL